MAEMSDVKVTETCSPRFSAVSEIAKSKKVLINWHISKEKFEYYRNSKLASGWLGHTGCSFHFTIYPNGRNGSVQNYVSLDIFTDISQGGLAEGTLSILGRETKTAFDMKSGEKNFSFDKFEKTEEIQQHLMNNDLIIQLSFEIISKYIKCDLDGKTVTYKSSTKCDFYSRILKNQNFADVTFILEDQEIKAHKVILSKVPSFKKLFEEESKEIFYLKDMKYNILKHVINFIYTEEIPKLNFRLACELYAVANDFDFVPLQKICASYLGSNLTAKNYLIVLILSKECNDRSLLEECLKFIQASDVKMLSQNAV